MTKFVFFLVLLASLPASALGQIDTILLNLGTHTEFYDTVQSDSSGGTRKFDFAPTLGAGLKLNLTENWFFLPELNWVLPQKAGSDRIIKNTLMYRADFAYKLLEWFQLRAGTSLLWQNQQGRGGSTNINNGNETSKFYYPDENRSSLNNTLDFGAEVLLNNWAVRLQTYIYSVFKEDKRQLSYTLFFTYYWNHKQ